MVAPPVFVTDPSSDRNGDGTSRYGNYLALHKNLFRDEETSITDPAEFALAAWRVANSPIMNPSYVVAHPRVQGTDAHVDYEYRPAVAVHLAIPTPGAMHRPALFWRGWTQDRVAQQWLDPDDNSRITVLAALTIRIPLPTELLPVPRYRLDVPDPATAKAAVNVVCAVLNRELAGLVAGLDAPAARR